MKKLLLLFAAATLASPAAHGVNMNPSPLRYDCPSGDFDACIRAYDEGSRIKFGPKIKQTHFPLPPGTPIDTQQYRCTIGNIQLDLAEIQICKAKYWQ